MEFIILKAIKNEKPRARLCARGLVVCVVDGQAIGENFVSLENYIVLVGPWPSDAGFPRIFASPAPARQVWPSIGMPPPLGGVENCQLHTAPPF